MEPDNLVLQPRDVRFDWSALPMHWVPDEPVTTHVMNVLHLLLPEGERWFDEDAVIRRALVVGTPGDTLAGIAAYERGSVHVIRSEVRAAANQVARAFSSRQ